MSIRHNWIYFFIGGFGVGVLWRSFFDFGLAFSIFLALLSLSVFFLYLITRNPKQLLVAIIIFGAFVGVFRFDISGFEKDVEMFERSAGSEVTLTGVVIDEADEREKNTKLTVLSHFTDDAEDERKVLITTERYPQYSYGDMVSFSGKLQKPKAFTGEDGREFDYPSYLGKDDIYYLMFYPEVEYIESGGGNFIKRGLFSAKRKFLENTGRVVPEPQASLLGGLVVGAKQSLGEELLDDFRRTGIIHIVVLSGYNVTIVAEFIMRVLSFLPLALTWSLGIISILLFALMTGAGATIVRASIMAILVIIARATGRTYFITRALIIAGFLMVLHNPKILVFDSSFQLSFMATVGLIYLAPKLESYFGWVPTKWQLREFATATIATQLFVLPMLLYKMGELSVVAFPVNLLVLPLVPISMLFGFFTGVIGFVGTLLSLPFAFVTNLFLSYQIFIVEIFSQVPFASVSLSNFPIWAAVLMYVLYGFVLLLLYKKTTN